MRSVKDSLPWFYEQIGCSCIDIVTPSVLRDPYALVVDDEALLKDRPVINHMASWLYGTLEHGQPICGDALIMQTVWDEDGESLDGLPEAKAKSLARKLKNRLMEVYLSVMQAIGHDMIA